MKSKLKNILITGTSSGIGKAIALKLLKHDCSVIGISRKHTIKNSKYIAYNQDISDLRGFSKLLEEIKNKYKNINVIISNAGEGAFNKLENFSDLEILNFFNLNLISHIILSKKMISTLKKNKKGIFIFIGSEASKIGGVQGTLYSAAKHALYGFVKSLRKEANKASIRVTIINPGMVRTSFFKALKFQPGKRKENALEASDIAELVYFLCQSSQYINFADINVDPIKKVVIKK
tara:strand:- start:1559 stop:2260 length:702 start_codon:yes stop_codon:yes gene_type:complete